MDDFRKIIYGTLIVFVVGILIWISFLTLSGCGFTASCLGAVPKVDRTSIPTLIPATLPVADRLIPTQTAIPTPTLEPTLVPGAIAPTPLPTQSETHVSSGQPDIARPSNPGGPGQAINLTGNADNGKQIFADKCTICHGVEGVGGLPNPGSLDTTVPSLNPIDPSFLDKDAKVYAFNLDLFLEHGSTPSGPNPTFTMPPWGDKGGLAPQQIADVIAYLMSLNPAP